MQQLKGSRLYDNRADRDGDAGTPLREAADDAVEQKHQDAGNDACRQEADQKERIGTIGARIGKLDRQAHDHGLGDNQGNVRLGKALDRLQGVSKESTKVVSSFHVSFRLDSVRMLVSAWYREMRELASRRG